MIALAVLLWSADCASCHPAQAASLAASRHAEAARLAVYAVSERHANTRWCASCHRPSGGAGLDCASCHRAANDAIRASHPPTAAALAAHPVVVDAAPPCARCHEFNTPLPDHLDPVVYSSQPLQTTVSEAGGRCSGCHDPHRPAGAHDPELVKRAVRFAARRTADGVIVDVTATGVGHRFPTGDPFRRVVVTVYDGDDHPIAQQQIARGFALAGGVWAPVVDHTLADGETRTLRFPPATRWRAELYYGDPKLERGLPAAEVSLELASGGL
jgi:hypothetical protein